MPISEALDGVKGPLLNRDLDPLLGVSTHDPKHTVTFTPTPNPQPTPSTYPGVTRIQSVLSHKRTLVEMRMSVELDLIGRYPVLCEQRSQDLHYGAAGGRAFGSKNHWEEAFDRRLGRVDKLTVAWRDSMLTEWASSLYSSRQSRYVNRIVIVKQCTGVYQEQYLALRESIVAERANLLAQFDLLDLELQAIIREEKDFFSYHASFFDRLLRSMEAHLERALSVVKSCLAQFVKHCGSIKRRGLERVHRASLQLQEDMERKCSGLIVGYTGGFAQGYFDALSIRYARVRIGC